MERKKYLCLQATGSKPAVSKEMSPSDMDAMYKAFTDWSAKYADQIVDMGGRLIGDGATVDGQGRVDGPLAEVKDMIGGYMIVSAGTLDEALMIAQESPGCMGAGTVTVREIAAS